MSNNLYLRFLDILANIPALVVMDDELDRVAARAVGQINEGIVGPYIAKLLVSHRQRRLEGFVQTFQVCTRNTQMAGLSSCMQ
jgi:hypothetical protein